MAVISSIRKRAGLIVAIIGIALFAFVLGDFKGQLFSSKQQDVGEVAGNSISYIAFENEVQRIADMQKERMRQTALDEETMNKIRDNVWEKFVNDLAVKPQFTKAGIAVSDNEVKDILLGSELDPIVVQRFTDPKTGQVAQFMRDPLTGTISGRTVKAYDDTLSKYKNQYPADWNQWVEFQQELPELIMEKKYLTLIKKGLYVTTAQAKQDHENLSRSVNSNYILKPYSSLPDSLVQVNDQDMLKYYNENQYKFKQDASRKLEYVIFDVKPSQDDFTEVKNQLEKIGEEWKQVKNVKDDSLLVVRESESRFFDTTYYGKGLLAPQIDSIAFTSEKGTLLPLYLENGEYKLSKVIDWKMSPDSVKARHILIKVAEHDTVAKKFAKAKIDSIKSVIQKKKDFEAMAKKFSEDAGSKDTGGVLGWFTTGKMVPEFQNACFNGKKGDLVVVFSKFGYHLIEILDQSPLARKTEVATIDRKVEPGSKTRQEIYNHAVDFISKYHTSETFDKGVEESHLVKRLADPLKESDKAIAGIDDPRAIIRWAFSGEKGDVSTEPLNFSDKYVVAHIAEIREEGIAPLEQKKEEVTLGAIKAKKAEKFIEEMNKLNAKTPEEYASKLNLKANSSEGSTFTAYNLPNIGRELNVYGPLFSLKEKEVSKPITGESGVYIIQIDKITEAPAVTDYTTIKTQSKGNFSYRADIEVIEAIKKKAEIKDNRTKFF